MTFADILDGVASKHPDKLAIKFENNSFTYAQLRARVDSLSNALLASGLQKGDRIALLSPDCHQYVELYLASARCGIILVPLNTRLTVQELEFILNDCRPAAMIFDQEFSDCLENLRPRLSFVGLYVHIGSPLPGAVDYEALVQIQSPFRHSPACDDDILCILYTSGTTGFPKGAVSTNGNWMANNLNVLPVMGVDQSDVNFVMTPLFHAAAVWPVFLHLYVGGTTVLARKFTVRSTLETIERERVTFCHPVLSQVVSLLEDPDIAKHDLRSLRTIQCGMSLPVPAFRRALKIFGNIMVPGYGLTEAGPMVTLMPRHAIGSWEVYGDDPQGTLALYGTCGTALPNVDVKLVDEDGREVAPGEIGEITLRSESVMKCYWNRPESTAQALRNGWLHTGDVARMDEAGFVYFIDRKSGMIKTGGENVFPKEVEDAIASHPAVLEVAVFGVPDNCWGETVKAVVALRRGASATADELIDHCRKLIAGYKKPTSVDFFESLPRTPTGKVMKSELRAKYASSVCQ